MVASQSIGAEVEREHTDAQQGGRYAVEKSCQMAHHSPKLAADCQKFP